MVNYFNSLMSGDQLQTFTNITSSHRETLTVFCRKNVKRQSMATAKHEFRQLVFNPANRELIDFLNELQRLSKDAFGVAAQAIIEQFMYATMPLHLKRVIAWRTNCTLEQIDLRLEKELELKSLEAPDELQINTVRQQITKPDPEKPKPTCHHSGKPSHHRNQSCQLKREKTTAQNNTISAGNNKNKNGGEINLIPKNRITNNTKTNNANRRNHRKPVIPVVKSTVPQRNVTL